jgi:hypothetical protein
MKPSLLVAGSCVTGRKRRSRKLSMLAMALGGGLDLRTSRHLYLRLGQADYLKTQHNTTSFGGVGHQNNICFSAGLVFTFGSQF